MRYLAWMLLVGTLAATVAKLPDVPENYQGQFKDLVIKQQALVIDESRLQKAFVDDEAQLKQVNAEGQALEGKLLKDLGLDPAKYTTQFKDGKMTIIEKPQEKK